MTARSTSATDGRGVEHTPTPLSADGFAEACREIVASSRGHEMHLRLDRLVTDLLSSLGYSEGMAIFMEHAMPYHSHPRSYP